MLTAIDVDLAVREQVAAARHQTVPTEAVSCPKPDTDVRGTFVSAIDAGRVESNARRVFELHPHLDRSSAQRAGVKRDRRRARSVRLRVDDGEKCRSADEHSDSSDE